MNARKVMAYMAISVIGLFTAYNMNIFPEKIQATPQPVELPTLKFDMPKSFDLDIDLNSGSAKLSGNADCTADVTVNHPTKIVEKVVYKPSKPVIKYETKTEYVTRMKTFHMPSRFDLHISRIEYPQKVYRK